MTDTSTCRQMNGLYEVLKGCTVSEIIEMQQIIEAEHTGKARQTMVYCCKETIRRKNAGIWK
jgi:hypothetical protein